MAIIDRLGEFTQPTGQEDLMDVSYPSPRVKIPLRQAFAVAAVLLVAVVGWLLISSRSSPSDVGAEFVAVEADADAEAETEVVVSVVGAVAHPGLVTLPPGSRVADALAAAGPHPEADLIALNQAQLLMDGQQIVVHLVGEAPAPAPGGGQVSLNNAGVSELMVLDGVGEKTAQAIIDYRETVGGFTSIEQLLEVPGIGQAKFAGMRDDVSL